MVHRNCASSLKGRTDQQLLATKAKCRGLLGLSTLQLAPCISALTPRPVAAHIQQRSCSHHPHTAACPGMAARWLCVGVRVGLGQAGECTQAAGCSWGAGESCCLQAPAGQPAQQEGHMGLCRQCLSAVSSGAQEGQCTHFVLL